MPIQPIGDPTLSERQRIEFLIARDGQGAAREWVERTLKMYREALASGSHAVQPEYRFRFEASIREFERWLSQTASAAASPGIAPARDSGT